MNEQRVERMLRELQGWRRIDPEPPRLASSGEPYGGSWVAWIAVFVVLVAAAVV